MSLPQPRYALFTNGSFLSRAVLKALLDLHLAPVLIVLPDYPPATTISNPAFGELDKTGKHPISQLSANIPLAYAPKAQQTSVIDSLGEFEVDLILVACWPYLIDSTIIRAVSGQAINLHPSALPRFRGADPISAQLASGHRPFAVSLHYLSDQFDQGDLVGQAEFEIDAAQPDRHMIEKSCATEGVRLFAERLKQHPADWPRQPQQCEGQQETGGES